MHVNIIISKQMLILYMCHIVSKNLQCILTVYFSLDTIAILTLNFYSNNNSIN